MAIVTCSGLGSGTPPYSKDVPTEDMYENMSTQGVQILLDLDAYKRLVNWASMSRTMDYVLRALEEAPSTNDVHQDHLDVAHDELTRVRDALDKCHQAVRRHWANLPHQVK
jgi:hypothetical protein